MTVVILFEPSNKSFLTFFHDQSVEEGFISYLSFTNRTYIVSYRQRRVPSREGCPYTKRQRDTVFVADRRLAEGRHLPGVVGLGSTIRGL